MRKVEPPSGWQHTRSFDGTAIAWRLDGPDELVDGQTVRDDGIAVVLCNGITCDDTYWRYIWPVLAEEVPVVRFNYRGHAGSEHPADPGAITVDDVVQDLATVLNAANVHEAVLVGHSYGVKIAWEADVKLPTRVAGLVAVAGSVYRPLPVVRGVNLGIPVFEGMRLAFTPALSRRLTGALLRSGAAFPIARLAGFLGPHAPRDVMQDWFDQLAERDMPLMMRMMRAMQEHSLAEVLPDVKAPAIVLAGARDLYTPPPVGRSMARKMPDARFEAVPETTHVLPVEAPDRVVDATRALLARARER